ncbi:MAG: hypothetical protein HYX92_13660 [Chloroflexi bacterium]|nr:hypothetical protein [Chloroflexota bacterium]
MFPWDHGSSGQVEAVLRRRGFKYGGEGDPRKLIFPSNRGLKDSEEYYKLMSKISFRKLLKLVEEKSGLVERADLVRICSEPKLSHRLRFLEENGMANRSGNDAWQLSQSGAAFGYTLEAYVAQVCEAEFAGPSKWGVQIEGLKCGGDFDVFSWFDPALAYIECKTTLPDKVPEAQVRNFLQRAEELAPELAILLVDTDSSLNPLLETINRIVLPIMRKASGIADPEWQPGRPFMVPPRGFDGIHFGLQRVFVVNAKPSIVGNIRLCLRYYSTVVRHSSFWGGPRKDYLTGEVFDY